MSKFNDIKNFMAGSGIGLIVGSIVAIWLSPRNGEENREEVHFRVLNLQDDMQERIYDITDQVQTRLPFVKSADDDPQK